MNSFELDLGPFGAPGFQLRERLDFTGHASGRVLPHINADLCGPSGVLGYTPGADFRDLTHNQLPGFNNI